MVDQALEIKNLHKSYGQVDVLEDISVSMGAGDFLVLVGPSGCGKSTLLNCIAGLEDVTSGGITIAGREVTETPPKDRDIAMVFQSYALYPTMSVAENIGFGMKIRHAKPDDIKAKTTQVAKLLQIEHLLNRKPSQLSGGQRQRVAMGRALVREPKLFLFDEPLSNLDAKLRVEMRAEIKRLHQTTGTSIVYVTHDQVEAMTMATKIVVLKDGVVQQIGSPEEIYHGPANTFVADFMGSPPMNLIPAQVDEGGRRLRFADGATIVLPPERAVSGQSKVIVGVRPEDFSIGNGVAVRPIMSENTGSDTYLTFELGGKTAIARLPGRTEVGKDALELSIDPSALCLFTPDGGQRISVN